MDEADDKGFGVVDLAPSPIAPEEILAVRRGPGANCSSIGSALDLLFLSAVAAGAVMAAVAAAFGGKNEDARDEGGDAGEG